MGWGGGVHVPLTRMMLRCTYWVGVGWGGDVNVPLTRMMLSLHVRGWGGVGMLTFQSLENFGTLPQLKCAELSHVRMQFCKKRGPRKKNAGTTCIDRTFQSLKKIIRMELCNKHKLTYGV